MKKYRVKVTLEMDVEAKDKRVARKSVREMPWDLRYRFPAAGFVNEFIIVADEDSVKIDGIEEVK